jgi:uncharacterized membrane protein YebE (DUF533 family)
MQWDLGLEGLSALTVLSVGFGVLAGLLVGDGWARRLWTAAATTVACAGVGLLTSEWMFGWATEEELQPNIDGLSRDEVLLSAVITTALVVWLVRRRAHRTHRPQEAHPAGRA